MCLAFVYRVIKNNKKKKEIEAELQIDKSITKVFINPYKIDLKKNDLIRVQMGVVLEKIEEAS